MKRYRVVIVFEYETDSNIVIAKSTIKEYVMRMPIMKHSPSIDIVQMGVGLD